MPGHLAADGHVLSVRHALNHGAAVLTDAGIASARREARLILAAATGLTAEELLRGPDLDFEPQIYQRLLERRAAHEPLAFIVGYQEFWSLPFRVSPATLIPRADTETLIEAALATRTDGIRMILDLGTGTGCLLLAALTEHPAAFGVGTDRSPAAARLAAQNASDLGLTSRSAIVCADWAAPIAGRFDLILSNPPYIEHAAIPGLMPEVACFEPASALDGGKDGLDAYRIIIADLPRLLAPEGLAVIELGAGQAAGVASLARRAGFTRISGRKDLAGIDRALLIQAD